MIRGLYTSATGMIVQEKRQANVSNNLANVETNSFKQQQLIAAASNRMNVLNRANDPGNRLTAIGNMHFGAAIDDQYTDYRQGILRETKGPLDFAVDGDGYFTVALPDGRVAYTRDGSFRLNAYGELTTRQGYPVLGNGGQILPLGTEEITADAYGELTLPDGRVVALDIVDFEDPQALQRLGDNMVVAEGVQAAPATAYELKQGFLEGSNVDPLAELVKMIEITRSFESNQKAVQSMDETLGKAVNEVGRL